MEIARLESGETNYQALIHRPRVSYKISEYVWKYIYENYLFKLKLMSEDSLIITSFLHSQNIIQIFISSCLSLHTIERNVFLDLRPILERLRLQNVL